MSILVDEYTFEGPFTDDRSVKDQPGVFVIHCCKDAEYTVVDVGASDSLRSTLREHDRRFMLKQLCDGTLTIAVMYTSGDNSVSPERVEERIRQRLLVPNAARGRPSVAAKHGTGAAPPE